MAAWIGAGLVWVLLLGAVLWLTSCRGDGDAASCIYQCQTVRIALPTPDELQPVQVVRRK